MPAGQSQFPSAGQPGGFMVLPHIEAELFHESRQKSIVGKMSMLLKSDEDIGNGPYSGNNLDAAAILTKVLEEGDEYRFQLVQNIKGSATFGDLPPGKGDYLAFLNAKVQMNMLKIPAVPILDKMSLQRIKGALAEGKLTDEIKNQIKMWFAEQYVLDFYFTLLKGASPNLLAPKAQGGLGYVVSTDLGAGVQVSPQHFVVAGSGYVSGTSGTAAHETDLVTKLSTLDNDASKQLSLSFLHNFDASLTARKLLPMAGGPMNDGKEEYVCPIDPDLLVGLTAPGGQLYEAYQKARERGKSNPVFSNEEVQVGRLRLVPDEWIKKFRPKVVGGAVVWGQNDQSNDKRDFVSDSTTGLMFTVGRNAVLEATRGDLHFTFKEGDHEVGSEWSAQSMQSFVRTRWAPTDGRALAADTLIERGLAVCAFNIPPVTL